MKPLTIALSTAVLLFSASAFAQEYDGDHERERGEAGVGIGLDFISLSPGGAGDSFGGFGVSVRHPLDSRISVEGTLAAVRAQDATSANPYSVHSYPAQASVIGYVWPRSPFRLYGLVGGTIERDTVNDTSTGDSAAWTRAGGHLGIGLELVTGRVSWQMDTRYVVFADTPTAGGNGLPPPFTGGDAHMFRLGASMYF